MTPSHQPTLTINLGAITQNWQKLNGLSALGSAAVIKANAYGLGMEACGVALRDAGATRFFVATLDEGRALRETLGEKPWIGVLEGLSEVAAFQKHALTPVLNTLEQVQGWRGQTDVVIHLDTGMNRLGLLPSELAEAASSDTWKTARTALLMSHLASAEEPANPANQASLHGLKRHGDGIKPRFYPVVHQQLRPLSGARLSGYWAGSSRRGPLWRQSHARGQSQPDASGRGAERATDPAANRRSGDAGWLWWHLGCPAHDAIGRDCPGLRRRLAACGLRSRDGALGRSPVPTSWTGFHGYRRA